MSLRAIDPGRQWKLVCDYRPCLANKLRSIGDILAMW
jgi:hypothetical protein